MSVSSSYPLISISFLVSETRIITQGLTSRVTIDLAAGLVLPACFIQISKGFDFLGVKGKETYLLGGVLLEPLLGQSSLLSIFLLVIGAEKIDILIILLGGRSRRSSSWSLSGDIGTVCGSGLGSITGEGLESIDVAGNVPVPPIDVGVLGSVGSIGDGLVDGNISLSRSISDIPMKLAMARRQYVLVLDAQLSRNMCKGIRGARRQWFCFPLAGS